MGLTDSQIAAIRGVILAIVTALVTFGLVSEDVSAQVISVASAILTAVGVFVFKRPKDHA